MCWDVQILEVNSHLSVKAVGRYSRANLSDLFDTVRVESEKHDGWGVVLDVTQVAGTIPLMDMFVLGEHCSKVWNPLFRIAIVPPEEWVYKFFENVARNRGAQITIVANQDAALEWLATT